MTEFFVNLLLLTGSAFALIAGIGVVRMPDVYCRMHAATKAGAFGLGLLLFAVFLAAPGLRTLLEGIAIIGFFYLTAPIGAQMIGRVGIIRKLPLWKTRSPQHGRRAESEKSTDA